MGMKQEDAASKRDSLPLRVVTAAAGIPILAFAIWLGGIPLLLVTGAAALVAIWETACPAPALLASYRRCSHLSPSPDSSLADLRFEV